MQDIKQFDKWKQYEWLISKIFHDDLSSIDIKVLPNAKITGKYSERSRQIDILIKRKDKKIIIECKHYSKPLDVKDIETFIGLYNDINADNGIMISSNGFSKSARKRILEYKGKIKLEHLKLEEAYNNSFQLDTYGCINDLCEYCHKKSRNNVEVPGLLLWNGGWMIEKNGKTWMFHFAKCLKCNKITIYCDCCGMSYIIDEKKHCCREALDFQFLLETSQLCN